MKIRYSLNNAFRGLVIYAGGDTIASVILNEYSFFRMLGIMIAGSTLYAAEIPNYFAWIDRKYPVSGNFSVFIRRTVLAILYFNPLWIARHIFFIKVFSGLYSQVDAGIFGIGLLSFIFNIPISLIANYIIQNRIPYEYRFSCSAVFSSVMAVYYALSEVLFG